MFCQVSILITYLCGHSTRRGWLILLVLFIVPGLALTQTVQQSRTLIVNGQSGQVKVMAIDGRSYVDLESLAHIANGTLGFSGKQITLTLPSSAAGTAFVAAPPSPPANSGFSKQFLRAGIEEMALIREWRSALVNSIENNYPIQEDWVESYRGRASTSLGLASVAASTDSDRRCLGKANLVTDIRSRAGLVSLAIVFLPREHPPCARTARTLCPVGLRQLFHLLSRGLVDVFFSRGFGHARLIHFLFDASEYRFV